MGDHRRLEELQAKEQELIDDLAEYTKEKDRLKSILGSIGGESFSKRDNIVNAAFLAIILILFIMEITTHWLPPFVSLEVSVLLVSIKIVFMIHSQHKVNHFQFWILNSIEYRVNEIGRKMRKIEKEWDREMRRREKESQSDRSD